MKKYIKAGLIFAFLIGSIFVNANFSKVFAREETYIKLEDGVQTLYKNEMDPLRAVDACPGRGKHTMFRRGGATLIRVNKDKTRTTLFKGGAAWQCKYCREVVVTQHDPLSGITGYYSMRNPGYIISAIYTTMEASPNAIRYIYNGKPPYCNFYNN